MTKQQKLNLADALMNIEFTASAVTGSRTSLKAGTPLTTRARKPVKFTESQKKKIYSFYNSNGASDFPAKFGQLKNGPAAPPFSITEKRIVSSSPPKQQRTARKK